MTGQVLYLHKKPLTDRDRETIALARLARIHARTGAMIALWKARELLREFAEMRDDEANG